MPKPFANSQPITPSLISGDWLLGIQTGNSTGDNGLPQMKYIKLSQLTDWVRSNFGEMWRYRGGFSASLPSDPQDGDYFLATATFSVGADTYTKDHLYAYNGSSWDDISDILTQYASQSQVTDIDDRLTVVEVKVDAMGDGVVYKGEVATYADLAGIVDPKTGWEYFVTANASFYIYNGSSWDQIDNGIVQTITDGDTAHAPSGDAVYDALAAEAAARTAADSNLKDALTAIDHRVQNLEQAKGDYVVTNYKDGAITPSGKGNWAVVEGLRGVSRVENNIVIDGTFAQGTTYASPYNPNYTQVSASDNVLTHTVLPNGASYPYETGVNISTTPFDRTHSYLRCFSAKPSVACTIKCELGGGAMTESQSLTANAWNFVATIGIFAPYDNKMLLYPSITPTSMTVQYKDVFIVDLNIYFGTTDLSYLGATDSAKLATIQKDYPHLLIPSEYGTRIVDASYVGVRAKGVNLWDEVWQAGGLNISTGADDDTRTNRVRSENYIPVNQYKTYYYLDNSETWWAYFYDADKNFIGRNAVMGTTSFYPLAGSFFMRFETWNGYGNVYKYDVQISEVFNNTVTTLNTTYHPYMENTLSLSFNGKSAGSVYDSCEPNVEVEGVAKKRTTERIGSYTFDGTENIGYGSGYFQWNGLNDVIARPTGNTDYPNIMMPEYKALYWNKSEDMALYIVPTTQTSLSNYIWWRNTAYSDASSFKATLVGKTIYFELADPVVTLSDPVLDNTLLTESGGRMATVQTGTVVDGSFDMGFITL